MSNCSFQIIGAGLMRTGTTSLKEALHILHNGGKSLHMTSVWTDTRFVKQWNNLLDSPDSQHTAEQWTDLLAGHIAALDIPACIFFEELLQHYPQAKVILTVRDDAEIWYKSLQKNILEHLEMSLSFRLRCYLRLCGCSGITHMTLKCMHRLFGRDKTKWTDTSHMMKAYHRWNDRVVATVPPERLLVFNVNQGWAELCKFLDLPVPACAFPHENSTSKFRSNMEKLNQRAWLMWVVFIFFLLAIYLCWCLSFF